MNRCTVLKILGIESSCDETAAAVVEDGRKILSSIIFSQARLHSKFGGVVPEIASRKHVEAIVPVISEAIRESGLKLADLDGFSVSSGPGLIGALLVGVSAAKALASVTGKPLYAVNHIAGHISANYLSSSDLEPPFICLVASGGHSHIVLAESFTSYKVIGRTRDDAAGEAFDKVARVLGLGYPGGPAIDKASFGGDPSAYKFPEAKIKDSPYDFSFSGLKTRALSEINSARQKSLSSSLPFDKLFSVKDFAASFQENIAQTLVKHTISAAETFNADKIAIAGGVAANRRLRELMKTRAEERGMRFFMPDMELCTDNAAMIAAAGCFIAKSGKSPSDMRLTAKPSLKAMEEFSA